MINSDLLSINNVADKLQLSVHQLRRWELMFGLEIKRGRGQQRQYRPEDLSVLERIKELVEQGWPTSQIRPQLEAEGLLTPKLIGMPTNPGNPEVLQESIIGLRSFVERRFIEISKQVDELRQLLISITLKQELSTDKTSPWQPVATEYVQTPKAPPPQEITIGPQISIDPPGKPNTPPPYQQRPIIGAPSQTVRPPERAPETTPPAREITIGGGYAGAAESGEMAAGAAFERGLAASSQQASPANEQIEAAETFNSMPLVRHSTIPPLPQPATAMQSPENPQADVQMKAEAETVADEGPAEPAPAPAAFAQPQTVSAPHAVEQSLDSGAKLAAEDRFAIPPLPPNPFKTVSAAPPLRNEQGPPVTAERDPILESFAPQGGEYLQTTESLPFAREVAPEESQQAPTLSYETAPEEDLEEVSQEELEAEDYGGAPAPYAQPAELGPVVEAPQASPSTPSPQVNFGPNVSAPTPQVTHQRVDDNFGLGEVTDQNYLTVLGRALDLIGWTDEQADSYSLKAFSVPHWDELGRSQAEKLVAHLVSLLKEQLS